MMESLNLSPDASKGHLLVVDDEQDIRQALARALTFEGYTVDEAETGEQALKCLAQTSCDLMLVDIVMPGMGGVELMQQARQRCPGLLIIVLTGHATLDSAIAAIKSQATDFLQKPTDTREIINIVARVLQIYAQQLRKQHLLRVIGQAVDDLRRGAASPTNSELAARSLEILPEPIVHVHPLTLDRQKRSVTVNSNAYHIIHLTEGETAVLGGLMNHPDKVFTCKQLAYASWGFDMPEHEARTLVRPHISRLRRKIRAFIQEPELIYTVRGQGYIFLAASAPK